MSQVQAIVDQNHPGHETARATLSKVRFDDSIKGDGSDKDDSNEVILLILFNLFPQLY